MSGATGGGDHRGIAPTGDGVGRGRRVPALAGATRARPRRGDHRGIAPPRRYGRGLCARPRRGDRARPSPGRPQRDRPYTTVRAGPLCPPSPGRPCPPSPGRPCPPSPGRPQRDRPYTTVRAGPLCPPSPVPVPTLASVPALAGATTEIAPLTTVRAGPLCPPSPGSPVPTLASVPVLAGATTEGSPLRWAAVALGLLLIRRRAYTVLVTGLIAALWWRGALGALWSGVKADWRGVVKRVSCLWPWGRRPSFWPQPGWPPRPTCWERGCWVCGRVQASTAPGISCAGCC